MKAYLRKFHIYWLQHFALVWLVTNIFNLVNYAYKLSIWGPMTLNTDGTPITLWQMFVIHNFQKPDYLYLLLFTFLVELNYRYTFKRYNLAIFVGVAIIVAAIGTATSLYLSTNGFQNKYPTNLFEPWTAAAIYAVFYGLIREFFYQRLYRLKVRVERSETELNSLKQQLNPHFLFNTLNYLYGTALQEKAERTAEGIDMVAAMMRYTVAGVQETFVPLNEEIQFIRNYISLQKLRLPAGTAQQVKINIDVPDSAIQIAPMLLLPFIENAFKYGISNDQASTIEVDVGLHENSLGAIITNTIAQGAPHVKGTRSGIDTCKKRLELLYPESHTLKIMPTPTSYSVNLLISLKQ
ncbi:histidine kinase [Mucilaginibacter terrenus]|uniref:Histidine kinase n=1 Tax=Mucilaginibacter terrenus TaxID=2482727 RepID=A0A3E2NMW6_9SPHI|nr:sensor histidine kinase [Mucilaginibacter terrenus]RFZ82344.1 histidine kinase [Mucilaginibacter terrenus]